MVSADIMFAALQIQEKCYEQQMDLNQDFIDLSKVFETVNRIDLWHILSSLLLASSRFFCGPSMVLWWSVQMLVVYLQNQ